LPTASASASASSVYATEAIVICPFCTWAMPVRRSALSYE
jgi:hypothetical protein